jgi:hypothetical protein
MFWKKRKNIANQLGNVFGWNTVTSKRSIPESTFAIEIRPGMPRWMSMKTTVFVAFCEAFAMGVFAFGVSVEDYGICVFLTKRSRKPWIRMRSAVGFVECFGGMLGERCNRIEVLWS